MKIAIFANTPAQVHFYRNIVKGLEERGHRIDLALRDYGETIAIANALGIEYFIYSRGQLAKISRSWAFPSRIIRACRRWKEFKPDIISGFGVYDACISALLGKPCIEFQDSESRVNALYLIQIKMYMPFVDSIITPESFLDNFGEKHIRIKGYKELAYLHPNYFRPDEKIFELLGLEKNEDFVLLRFNAFDAVHDAGIRSFTFKDKKELIMELEKYAKVFISSEGKIPAKFKEYSLKIPLHMIHDVLYHAKLLVADSQTMTTEAGILGTPAVRCNSFVGKKDMSNFIELERKYGLIFNYADPKKASDKAIELLQRPDIKQVWNKKRDRVLDDKIDVTAFMVWFIENYPESNEIMKREPDSQNRFI